MKQDFICSYPNRWNEIYNELCKAYEKSTRRKLPCTAFEIQNTGGPPTPLILNGWVFTNDDDKRERWQETVRWAEKNNLLHLTTVDDHDKCYSAGHTRWGGIRCLGEYCDYTNGIIDKYNLSNYVTLNQYLSDPEGVIAKLSGSADSAGIYFVMYPYEWPEDMFLTDGTGGILKRKTPTFR